MVGFLDVLSLLGELAIFLLSDLIVMLCLFFFFMQTFGYLIIIASLSKIRRRKHGSLKNASYPAKLPSFTIIIPAYNEEKNLEKKLANTFELKYPKNLLEVIVVDDGSTDNTPKILEVLKERYFPHLKVMRQRRSGKSAAMDLGLQNSTGEMVVVSDADTFLESEALHYAIEDFANPVVGGVTCYVQTINGDEVSDLNKRIFFFLRSKENALGSVLGMSGPFAAFRRSLIDHFDAGVYACDMDVGILIRKSGHRVVYDERIVGYTEPLGRDYRGVVRYIKHTFKGAITMFLRYHDLLFNRTYSLYGNVIAFQYLLMPLIAPLIFAFMTVYVVWKVLMSPYYLVFFGALVLLLMFYALIRKVAGSSVISKLLDLVFLRVITYLTCLYVYFDYIKDKSGMWDTN